MNCKFLQQLLLELAAGMSYCFLPLLCPNLSFWVANAAGLSSNICVLEMKSGQVILTIVVIVGLLVHASQEEQQSGRNEAMKSSRNRRTVIVMETGPFYQSCIMGMPCRDPRMCGYVANVEVGAAGDIDL